MSLYKGLWIIYLGCNNLSLEIIDSLKKVGFRIFLIDKNKNINNLCLCDQILNIDCEEKFQILENIKSKINKNQIALIIESGEFAQETAAFLRSKLKLQGLKEGNVENFLDKNIQKEILSKNNIKYPKTINFGIEKLDLFIKENNQCVIKAPKAFGGDKVWIIKSKKEVADFISENSRLVKEDSLIIQEYIFGKEIYITGFMKNGNYESGIACEVKINEKNAQLEYIYFPPDLSLNSIKKAHEILAKSAKLLSLNYGPIGANMIFKENEFYIIDIASLYSLQLMNLLIRKINFNLFINHLNNKNITNYINENDKIGLKQFFIEPKLFNLLKSKIKNNLLKEIIKENGIIIREELSEFNRNKNNLAVFFSSAGSIKNLILNLNKIEKEFRDELYFYIQK